ncbi:MAG: CDP-alcohol phosphatidyltransferase family protein, partial [Verrucomicrobiota bacterium]|nr:CDP-alcohol phosphatidyltransferase family protein [Verrucomicrobiota bacterium]
MAAPAHGRRQAELQKTYKGREIEGVLDLYFYRPIGYWVARLAQSLRLSPAVLTVIGGVVGVVAGHFYYYPNFAVNGVGMLLHVVSNTFDNADGQLARLIGKGSRVGRALDGLIDNVVFLSVYVHLCLRATAAGGTGAIWLLGLAAATSHSVQSCIADYLRNAYLYFSGKRSELESSEVVNQSARLLSWQREGLQKLLLTLYLSYTREQEMLTPKVAALYEATKDNLPDWMTQEYRRESHPMVKLAGALTTNARM